MKIESFIKKHKWYYVNPALTSENFPVQKAEAGGTLLPLDKYYPNSQAVLDMLKEKGLRAANVYELMAYFDEHKDDMPKNRWYPAFGSIWKVAGGRHRVPFVDTDSVGGFEFSLGRFGEPWVGGDVVLVFGDKTSGAQTPKKQGSEPLTLPDELSYLSELRQAVVQQYESKPTGYGGSFGEILCWEIHENGLTFEWLAEKWGITLSTLGELIKDHCDRLQPLLKVDHKYRKP